MSCSFFGSNENRYQKVSCPIYVSSSVCLSTCSLYSSACIIAPWKNHVQTKCPSRHLVSPLVCRGPWMSIVVLYCWCHSDGASVLLYFTFYCKIQPFHVIQECDFDNNYQVETFLFLLPRVVIIICIIQTMEISKKTAISPPTHRIQVPFGHKRPNHI